MSAVQKVLVDCSWILNKTHLKLRLRGEELVAGSGPEPEKRNDCNCLLFGAISIP